MLKTLFGAAFAVAILSLSAGAKAETTECTEITSLPAVITVQGIYCFKQNLVTSAININAIEVQANNVTIDLNGFKLGGSAGGVGTFAIGIRATDRKNITVRNGNIRGFYQAILFDGTNSSGHVVEEVRADGNRHIGIQVYGDNAIIRRNHIINIGPGNNSSSAQGIFLRQGSNALVEDNVISGLTETGLVVGINVYLVTRSVIQNNSIFELDLGSNRRGINIINSSGVTVRENQIDNTGLTGSVGILDETGSTGVACIDNVTIGFTVAHGGCDLVSGHQNL